MKKTRFLALTLAIAVMLMGAGYAAWTDQLNITNNVSTGHLDVHFVDIEDELSLSPYETGSVTYSQDNEGGQNDWDTAVTQINNVYPGGKFTIKYRMYNNSTMPVKLASLDFGGWGEWVAAAGGTVNAGEGISSGIGKLEWVNPDGTTVERTVNPFDPSQYLDGQVEPGHYLDLYVNFAAGDSYAEDTTYTVEMTPIFKQFNK